MALDAADQATVQAAITKAITDGAFLSKAEFNGSAAIIRQLKEGQDAMRTSNPALETLVTAGVLEKDPVTGMYKAKATAAPTTKPDAAVPEWQKQINDLVAQGKAKDTALAAEKTARLDGERKSAVITALTAAGAVNAARDYLHVLPSVVRAEDGTYHTVTKDAYGVETKVPLEAAFKGFLTSNPELARAAGKPGSGTPAGGSGGTGSITVTRAQMTDPAWYAANRKDVIAGNVNVVG
jgi:hypothetical protein